MINIMVNEKYTIYNLWVKEVGKLWLQHLYLQAEPVSG